MFLLVNGTKPNCAIVDRGKYTSKTTYVIPFL